MLTIKRFYLHNRLRNYNYCLVDANNQALIIDPTDADLSIRFCLEHNLTPTQIWITHEDLDHYLGANQTSQHFNIPIFCPQKMSDLFHQANGYQHGDTLDFNGFKFNITHVPGHTPLHHVFLEQDQRWLISGDIIFNYGMGRVRQAQYPSMFKAINWIKSINDNCIFLNAHDYDLDNLAFAKTLQPKNIKIDQLIKNIIALKEIDRPLSTIGEQKQCNPFFNTAQSSIIEAVSQQSLPYSSELDVFTSLRKWRDTF